MGLQHIYENCISIKTENTTKHLKKIMPIFFNVSHGSRPNRSCHSALNDIQTWEHCNWFIKVDIRRDFDKINQKRLLNILRETIQDELIMGLIQQMFNTETLLRESGNNKGENVKVPFENPLTHLLDNIYLHKLDEFVIKRRNTHWNKNEHKPILSNEWKTATYVPAKELEHCKTPQQKRNLKRALRKEKEKKARVMNITRTPLVNERQMFATSKLCHKVYYVRYINEFLIGVRGPKNLAVGVKEEIAQFLKSDLQLKLDLISLNHVKSGKMRYLGFDIKIPAYKEITKFKLKNVIAFTKLRSKIKRKKEIMENKWTKFLDCIIRVKIANKTNNILNNIKNRIKAVKAANQVITNDILDKL